MILPRCCTTAPQARRHSGARNPYSTRWVVIHSAEAFSAWGIVEYFASPTARGSTHAVIDDNNCLISLPPHLIPWGAPGANKRGYHIELAGTARWSRAQWEEHRRMLDKAARLTAHVCEAYDIPLRWVGPWGLRILRPGLTTHADVSRAFRLSDHWDPGPGFPKDLFLKLVRRHWHRIAR